MYTSKRSNALRVLTVTFALLAGAAQTCFGQCTGDIDCDDLVSCTVDTCINPGPSGVCSNTPTDSLCDNGLFCDGVETCDPLLDCQAGTPPSLDDAVACTDDSCDEVNDVVVHTPNNANCDDTLFCNGAETCDALLDCQAGTPPNLDDAVACTDDSCDEVNDVVVHTPNNANCDDTLFCNGAETCDVLLDCQAGTAVDCTDFISCTVDTCDEVNDACVNTPTDSLCDNGLFCDGVETCDPLLDCQAGTAVDCNDGVTCTVDTCDEVNDACVNTPTDSLCDNGLFCDGVETCDALLDCQAGTAVDCTDGVSCTVDVCNEVNDVCDNSPVDGLCDNGLFCDGAETCDALLDCQPGLPPNIDDGVTCTDDSCDETNDVVVNAPNDANCDNGLFCDGAETCDPTLDCQSGSDPCPGQLCDETADACVDCFGDPDCDDGLFCNGVETCVAGVCVAGTVVDCNDGVTCTVDTCDEVNDVCVNTPTDSLCDNGLFCDGVETCDPLLDCQAGTAVDCNDGVTCTVDSCDEVNDVCANVPTDALCDNGQFCDGVETCDPVLDCQAGTPPNINDGVACTDDSCDEVNDTIVHAVNNANCDNGQFCDGVETCHPVFGCLSGTPVVCDDGVLCTGDTCDEVNDTCLFTPVNLLCSNGLFCDGVEVCDLVLDCQPGTPQDCSDGVSCTVDTCNETTDSCQHTLVDSLCDNGSFCDGVETCDPVLDCQPGTAVDCDDGVGCTVDSCDEINDACINTATDSLCDNGLFCDGLETCDPALDCQAGTPVNCDDGVGCTVDSCDEFNDVCANLANDSLCDNGQFCDGLETCDAVLDCQAGTAVNCDDGVACTTDTCDEFNDGCLNSADNSACDNGLFCDGLETCDPVLGCQAGTLVCDDNLDCTADSCNEMLNACVHTPIPGCQECAVDIDCNDGIGCTQDTCVAGSCVNTPNHALCNNGLFCDGPEVCDVLFDCRPGLPVNCTDGISCTVDTCDETNNVCVHTPNNALCNNGQFCDGVETCDTLQGCRPGSNPCADGVACTFDACNEMTDTCILVPIDSMCDNGVFCDGDEVCHPLFGCESGPSRCDDGVFCTVDTCNEVVNSCTNTPVDSLCDDGDPINGEEYCDPVQDCRPGAPLPLVHVVPVVLQSPSGLNTSTNAPPASDAQVEEGLPFVIELWAQQMIDLTSPALGGLCCVFADLNFADGVMSCTGTSASPSYNNFASGTCGAGVVNELGGCTFPLFQGITPDWVRIATVDMTADVASADNIVVSNPASTPMSICLYGVAGSEHVVFDESTPFTLGNPCIYDLDGDSMVTPGDLAFFAPCWLHSPGDPEWVQFNCEASNFDCLGGVNPGDLSFFASAWLKSCDDPTIVYPPPPCGTASGQALPPADRKTVESFGLVYPDDENTPIVQPSSSDLNAYRTSPDGAFEDSGEKRTKEGVGPTSVRRDSAVGARDDRPGRASAAPGDTRPAANQERLDP